MQVKTVDLQTSQAVSAAIEKHGASREALIPILSEVNRLLGYIPAEAFTEIKRQLRLQSSDLRVYESQLYSLASFYHMLSTEELGRHVVRFCESAPCHVVGGRELLTAVQETLGIQPGQTTPDRKWSLITTSCLGVCAVGPVLLVDDDIYGNVTPDQVPEILARYE
ncbi:MAG: NAD(P)H-dependent oxidoreductase subunit E [Chloroflexi bacterium]|jgi:NADH-quinone oxidoreductase subunit E|nr:NAD(P)H-dependent oxidoreductase subunit E [Chloroflexota bacterium]